MQALSICNNQACKRYAVLTGASGGLGKALAIELAERQIHVVLVGLPEQGLAELSNQLETKFSIHAPYYEVDFSNTNALLSCIKQIGDRYAVFMLINNAGVGGTQVFEQANADYLQTIIQVNITATTLFTHALLPNLKQQNQSYILNISSLAAFSPMGYKTIYPASKAFVHCFSRSLHQELKGTNVFVSVVNPGAMATTQQIIDRIEKQGLMGKFTILKPANVAKRCLTQLFKKDSVIMLNPVSWLLLALLPIWIKMPLLTRIVKRELAA